MFSLACKGTETRCQFLYRNYTNENYNICVDVVRKGFRSCPRVSSKVEKPLSLPVTISNTTAEEQCKMKVIETLKSTYFEGKYDWILFNLTWGNSHNSCRFSENNKCVKCNVVSASNDPMAFLLRWLSTHKATIPLRCGMVNWIWQSQQIKLSWL